MHPPQYPIKTPILFVAFIKTDAGGQRIKINPLDSYSVSLQTFGQVLTMGLESANHQTINFQPSPCRAQRVLMPPMPSTKNSRVILLKNGII